MVDDEAFRLTLRERIRRYADQEASIQERVLELQEALDDLKRRRRSAEQLYKAEFGDDVHITATTVRLAGELEPSDYQPTEVGSLYGAPWSDAITTVLGEAAEPLHVKEIWRQMRDRGFTSTALDPLGSIVTVALRTPGVVRAGPNIYTLARGEA